MKTAMIIASDAGARTAGIIREELCCLVGFQFFYVCSLYRNGAGVSGSIRSLILP